MTGQKEPLNWPTAVVLVALFALFAALVWAVAYMVAS